MFMVWDLALALLIDTIHDMEAFSKGKYIVRSHTANRNIIARYYSWAIIVNTYPII